jgi:hypothetical protein
LFPSLPPNGSFASGSPGLVLSSRVGRSYVVLPITSRSIDRIAADSANSGSNANFVEGAPLLVFPP